MIRSFQRGLYRTAAVLVSATVLQAGGCAVDLQTIVPELASQIATALVNNLVFGALNLTG